jgi:hypothetical protein
MEVLLRPVISNSISNNKIPVDEGPIFLFCRFSSKRVLSERLLGYKDWTDLPALEEKVGE